MKKVFCVILFLNPDAHLINMAIPGVTKSWIQEINHELSLPLAFLTLALTASVQDFKDSFHLLPNSGLQLLSLNFLENI